MNRFLTVILILLAADVTILAVPSTKLSPVIFDQNSDPEMFAFMPTPPWCELQIVTSNLLVWRKYDWGLSASNTTTTIYTQERVGQRPIRIIRFSGGSMPGIVGVSLRGSLLFKNGEEFIVADDASARTSSAVSVFFLPDSRRTCPFDVQTSTLSPTMFVHSLWESKNKSPEFTFAVFRKSNTKTSRKIQVKVVPDGQSPQSLIHSGPPPPPTWIKNLWPIVKWDDSGFTIWNGNEWIDFKWDAIQ